MAKVSRSILKLAVIGALAAAAVKYLQRRSHPDPVVDRNAYNSWERLDETPATPEPKPDIEPAATNGSTPTAAKADTTTKKAPAKKPAAKKTPAKKTPAKKKAAPKKTPAKKKAAPKKTAGSDEPTPT